MGPKKQQQQKGKGSKQTNTAGKGGAASGGGSSKNKGTAQVQISSENERKLRQLLQNTGNFQGGLSSGSKQQPQEELSVGQKKSAGRRLRNIYDTLLSEGFSSSQIEQALGSLQLGGATLEAALDWLCLNLPANELPTKFSSGFKTEDIEGGSVQVLAAARPEWAPTVKPLDSNEEKDELLSKIPKPAPIIREKKPDKVVQAEQAQWIKRYLAKQEEASDSDEDGDGSGDSDWEMFADKSEQHRRKEKRQVLDPQVRSASIANEFQKAKEAAAEAKKRGDKEKQAAAGRLIRELRQEMASLGLSESALKPTVSRDPFLGLRSADFPTLGEATKKAFPSIAEARSTAFPSLGDAPRKDFPELGEVGNTHSLGDSHSRSTGMSFAAMMKDKQPTSLGTGKSERPSMMRVSKGKNLPDWARPMDEENLQTVPVMSHIASSQDAEAHSGAKDAFLEMGSLSEPMQAIERGSEEQYLGADVQSPGEVTDSDSTWESTQAIGMTHHSEIQQEDKVTQKDVESVNEDYGGMLGMFDEEAASEQPLPESVLNSNKSEKITAWGAEMGGSRRKQITVNKKSSQHVVQDDALRQPKAVLQQHCQKNGWAPPKYEKLSARGRQYAYTVTVTRPTVGRGKNKIVGGPLLCKLPEQEDYFETIADAQNAVATWALFRLLPDLPLHQMLPEPYRTMCLRWQTSGQDARKEMKGEEVRRASFVDSLLNSSISADTILDSGSTPEQTEMEEEEVLDDLKRANNFSTKDKRSRFLKEAESRELRRRQSEKAMNDNYKAMQKSRATLPMTAAKDDFLKKVRESEVVVVSGETGCGKTTQVPQYILDEMITNGLGGFCNIICTQPRRIAAISVAERVSAERCDAVPGASGSLVGYQVRHDTARSASTKLLFCTTGILLRRLGSDRDLNGVSHVVVDEVHERTVLGDFLLVILKDLLDRRSASGSPLKLILMSATLDSELFSKYFSECPVIKAKGRTFPVTNFYLEDVHERLQYRLATDSAAAMQNDYRASKSKASRNLVDSSRGRQNLVQSGWGDDQSLEEAPENPLYDRELYAGFSERTRSNLAKLNEDVIDYDLIEDLIIHIDEEGEPGAILVFLPGMAEIQFLWDRLAVSRRFSGSALEWLLPLHSSVASSDQRRVFQRPPPGHRKVVLATNIAETSITIDDVVHVIDSGKHKENRFNARRGMSSMVEVWISQANAKQRSGRAGRVRPGNCFCLYTRNRFQKLLRPFQLPEILRVPLVELCLQIKLLRLGSISFFLERALEPPTADAVLSAISTLRQVGALDEAEALTSLGYHLAYLPVDVRVGKMLIFGAVLGCLSPILTIAACLSHKSPFASPHDQREAAERAKQLLASDRKQEGVAGNVASGQQSDHLAMAAAYDGWNTLASLKGARAAREYCTNNFLSIPTLTMLRDMRNQFASLLADIGFIRIPEGDRGRRTSKIESIANDLQQHFNQNSHLPSVVKAALCAGLYPNVAAMEEESVNSGHASALSRRAGLSSGGRAHWSDGRREVFIHPTSVNHKVSEFRQPFVVFHEKVETSRVYLRDTTVISAYALLLFGGAINVQHQTGRVTVDTWLEMNSPAQTAVLFKNLRSALDSLLNELIQSPQGTLSSNAKEVISSIAKLLVDEDKVLL